MNQTAVRQLAEPKLLDYHINLILDIRQIQVCTPTHMAGPEDTSVDLGSARRRLDQSEVESYEATRQLHGRIVAQLDTLHQQGRVEFPIDFMRQFLNSPARLRDPGHPTVRVTIPDGVFDFTPVQKDIGGTAAKLISFTFRPHGAGTDRRDESMSIAWYESIQDAESCQAFLGDALYFSDEKTYPGGASSPKLLERMEQVLQPFFDLEIPQASPDMAA